MDTLPMVDDVDQIRAEWLKDRIRLKACLAVLEQLNLVFDQFPELTDPTTKRGRVLANLKHNAQKQLLITWHKGE